MTPEHAPQRHSLTTPDGRQLEILVSGPPDGMPLVFHTGTPGGLTAWPPMIRTAAALDLRTVMYARPGYGGSTAQPGRQVAGAAADVAAILDQLGAGPFVTAGWSGGGPHALACAALLPGRCLAAASIAGVAPYDGPGLDWLAGMGPENLEEFGAAAAGQEQLSQYLDAAAGELSAVSATDLAAAMGGLIAAADLAVLTGDFAEYLAESFRVAVSHGAAGWRDDDLAFTRGWGFSLADCGAVPVAIWQGGEDRMVPTAHGSWLAAQLPAASARLLPAEGHLTLVATRFGQILAELAEAAG